MHLLIKYPTRARPKLFVQTLSRYRAFLSGKHQVSFVITADSDDETMNTPEMRQQLDRIPNLKYRFGNSKTKIEAVNADFDLAPPDFSVVLLASDDMLPVERGYDDIIAVDMARHYPDFDGALWYADGLVNEKLFTLSILGRKLYDQFSYLYFPEYRGFFCDNEAMDVYTAMGKIIYLDKVIVGHAHVSYTGVDALHLKNNPFYEPDRVIYFRRKAAGFPPPAPPARL